MASFIYLYSKFTEEFLLLTAAGSFTLLAFYCYTWVVKKRRLGAARNQVPAGLVKVYLNQLINEAQFVRTQLFGLIAGSLPSEGDLHQLLGQNRPAGNTPLSAEGASAGTAAIPDDLWERLKALEHQLAEKESMVVNINVEKSKLLEELDHIKQEQKAGDGNLEAGNPPALVEKIKALEERLEEYALFEDDLANLKRLQQENTQLKKRVEEQSQAESKPTPAVAAAPAIDPVLEAKAIVPDPARKQEAALDPSSTLDAAAVEALLEGTSPIPHTEAAEPAVNLNETTMSAAPSEPAIGLRAVGPSETSDEFENLVDSVEGSLNKEEVLASSPSAPEPVQATPVAEKSDEELLKEFENLLNS